MIKPSLKHIRHCAASAMIAISALPLTLSAGDLSGASFKASSDSTVLEMGSQTHLRLELTAPSAVFDSLTIVNLPKADEEYNGIDIISVDRSEESIDGGQSKRASYDIFVQAFNPDLITLPPFAAVAGTSSDTLFSNVVTLKVMEVELDSLQTLNPNASVAEPDSHWYDYIPDWVLWVVLGVVAAGLLVLILYITVFRRRKTILVRHKVVIPPYELAIRRMNELRDSKLTENGADKEYYTELTDILRQYLEGRFGIYALEMTTTEITKALRKHHETKLSADEIRQVLDMADFVKFAKVRPLPADNIRSYNTALKFIETTRPVPQPDKADEKPSGKES